MESVLVVYEKSLKHNINNDYFNFFEKNLEKILSTNNNSFEIDTTTINIDDGEDYDDIKQLKPKVFSEIPISMYYDVVVLITEKRLKNYGTGEIRDNDFRNTCFSIVSDGKRISEISNEIPDTVHQNDPEMILISTAHEIGHNIGLEHGDGSIINGKPTIMNATNARKIIPRFKVD